MANYRPILQKDYPKLLELDRKVYPTNNPVTPKVLDQWYQNNPEFGMIFENQNGMYGMSIAIPLNKKGWNNLISGKLAEADLDSKTIFDNSRDHELGVHIYHMEKFGNYNKFYLESLHALREVVKKLRKDNSQLRVIGFSGLAVTTQGIGLLYNKLNCRERTFINTEHILKKEGHLEIFNSDSQKALEKKIKEGYEYINRCKMLVTYPGELSLVWRFL